MKRPLFFAAGLAMLLGVASVAPTAAYYVVGQTGSVGPYSINDSYEFPSAACNYGNIDATDRAWFKGMKVKPPEVFAADRNSDRREHRRVTWQFKIQAQPFSAKGAWQTYASSDVQSATAYEDAAAPFSALEATFNAKNIDNPSEDSILMRALVIIKWHKASGAVEGSVKLGLEFYKYKSPFGVRVGDGWCVARDSAA